VLNRSLGYNYGAGNYDRVLHTLKLAMLFATLICVAGFLVVMLAPSQVIAVFNRTDPQLRELGTRAIRICLVTFPIIGFQIVGSSYFQAVGKPQHALLLGLSRQVLLLIPAILILPRFFGVDGIWWAIPTADFCASVLTGTWLYVELRHLRDRHADRAAQPITPPLGDW
jgi:Na+-driven multidrug efflux pump